MKRNIKILLVLLFLFVLVFVNGYSHFGTVLVEEKLLFLDNKSKNSGVTVERYYKGVPENHSYTLSEHQVELWKESIKNSNYRVSHQKTFTIQNDYSYHFRAVEDGIHLFDVTISDNYLQLLDFNSNYLFQSKKSGFYEEISLLVNDWMKDDIR